jgi:hypothetical protein
MGEFPSQDTPVNKVKFFKVDAPAYDAATGKFLFAFLLFDRGF